MFFTILKTKLKLFLGKYRKESYSQCGEDLILDRLLQSAPSGFYVDIGANHPVALNNTYFFYKRGWRGINVEPHPHRYHQLQSLRKRDINLSLAVARHSGNLNFYAFKNDVLSTLSSAKAREYQRMGHALANTRKVQTLTLKELFKKYLPAGTAIDVMSIDTEGFDLEILKSNDWQKYRPQFLVIETLEYQAVRGTGRKLTATFKKFLEAQNYHLIADTYINSIFVDSRQGI